MDAHDYADIGSVVEQICQAQDEVELAQAELANDPHVKKLRDELKALKGALDAAEAPYKDRVKEAQKTERILREGLADRWSPDAPTTYEMEEWTAQRRATTRTQITDADALLTFARDTGKLWTMARGVKWDKRKVRSVAEALDGIPGVIQECQGCGDLRWQRRNAQKGGA